MCSAKKSTEDLSRPPTIFHFASPSFDPSRLMLRASTRTETLDDAHSVLVSSHLFLLVDLQLFLIEQRCASLWSCAQNVL